MTTVDFMNSLPNEVSEGEPATAEGAAHAFRSIEGLFQGGVHGDGENFAPGGALRGQSFRKNGTTEVFKRASRDDFWVGGGNSTRARSSNRTYDIPGGALRFRLRAPADVIVFFSATIHRFNRPDLVYHGTAGSGDWASGIYGVHGIRGCPKSSFLLKVQSWWEAEDAEPGREYEQARSVLKGWGALNHELQKSDKDSPLTGGHYADMSRGIFLPWRIRSVNTADPDWRTVGETVPETVSDTRTISTIPSSVAGGTAANQGRLQAGWHNIRHSVTDMSETSQGDVRRGDDEYVGDHARQTLKGLVFSNTELVVIANYGPRSDESATVLSGTVLDQLIQDKKASDKGLGIVTKIRSDL